MPPTTISAMRAAVRAAKATMTERAIRYHGAIENHLRAVRAETRAVPVYLSLDSDQALDALAAAAEAYESSRVHLAWIVEAERRMKSAARVEKEATR